MLAHPLQKAFSQRPFFWKRCSPNILAVSHLPDGMRVHLQLCLQEIHIKLIHYLKMLLSFLLIKSTFQIPAPNAQPMCSGHKLKHWLSVHFSHFSFICCPQRAFSISRTAISDLSYHQKTLWIKKKNNKTTLSSSAMPGTPGNRTGCQTQPRSQEPHPTPAASFPAETEQ